MTIDEAIECYENMANDFTSDADFYEARKGLDGTMCYRARFYGELAFEHLQIAKWLREIKEYKSKHISAIECNDLSEEDKARLIDLLKKPAPVTVTCDCQPIVREFPAACSDKMTKTEAIELIERNKSVFQYDDEMLQALELAIGALKYLSLYEGD